MNVFEYIEEHVDKEDIERLVIFYEFREQMITVYSGSIKEWKEQREPYWNSSVYSDGTDIEWNTALIEVTDI